jgi:hypothetical protein
VTAEAIDVQELAREIASRMAPDALLDTGDVGALLCCTGRYFLDNYALAPGFPACVRLTKQDGKPGKPKWRRSEVLDWVQKHFDRNPPTGGARRKN